MAKTTQSKTQTRPTPVPTAPAAEPDAVRIPAARKADKEAEVYLPVFDSNPGDDVLELCVNGKNYIIQRGVKVTVPLFLAEIIEHSDIYATVKRL